MSLLELFGEMINPGPVGDVDHTHPAPRGGSRGAVIARAVVSIAALGGVVWFFFDRTAPVVTLRNTLIALAVYVGVSALIDPQPDEENLGWAGGLFDNPFRWSDDMNRLLVLLIVLVWPGRFIFGSLRDLAWMLRGRHVIVLRPRDDD